MIRSVIIITLCALLCSFSGADSLCKVLAAEGKSGVISQLTNSADPTADEYMLTLENKFEASDISWQRLDPDDPYTLIINSSIILETAQSDNAISGISITAQGDFSALSGQIISDVLVSAITSWSDADSMKVRMELLDLISSAGGTADIDDIAITLALTNESIDMTIAPSDTKEPSVETDDTPIQSISDADDIVRYISKLLPKDWTQTYYVNVNDMTDVLINIYASTDDMDSLWDCARSINSQYWAGVSEYDLPCGRLSIVFYSSSMVPLLSLGIGRDDALGNKLILSSTSAEEFKAEFERLSRESNALVISYD